MLAMALARILFCSVTGFLENMGVFNNSSSEGESSSSNSSRLQMGLLRVTILLLSKISVTLWPSSLAVGWVEPLVTGLIPSSVLVSASIGSGDNSARHMSEGQIVATELQLEMLASSFPRSITAFHEKGDHQRNGG